MVNESTDIRKVGDLWIFRTMEAACGWLEPWWVNDQEGFAFAADGRRVVFGAGEHRVFVERTEAVDGGEATVRNWLQQYARSIAGRRGVDAPDGSITDLIAFLGFED